MLIRRFITMSKRDRIWLILSFLALVGAYLLWPILFCLKVDGDTSMSWNAVWIPLWVIDVLGVLFFFLLVSWGLIREPPGMEEGWHDPNPIELRIMALVKMLLCVLFQVFLVMRLDGYTDWSWRKVMSPLMLFLGADILGNLYALYNQSYRLVSGRVIEGIRMVLENVTFMIQLEILVLRLEGEVHWHWWAVFIPFWVYVVSSMCGVILNAVMITVVLTGDLGNENSSEDIDNKRVLEASILIDGANKTTMASCGTVAMVILAVKLLDGAEYSTFVVFIPVFLSAACLVCYTSGTIYLSLSSSPDEVDAIVGPPRRATTVILVAENAHHRIGNGSHSSDSGSIHSKRAMARQKHQRVSLGLVDAWQGNEIYAANPTPPQSTVVVDAVSPRLDISRVTSGVSPRIDVHQ